MPFEYVQGAPAAPQENIYQAPPQPQQQQQQGMSPLQGLDMYQKFSGGGGGAAAGGPSAGAGGVAAGGGAGSGAMGAIGGGGSAMGGAAGGGAAGGAGAGGGMAAAGPWAALAAVIMYNEKKAKKGGHRSEDSSTYYKDLLRGDVLTQDIEERWNPKIYGEDMERDYLGTGGDTKAMSELASLHPKDALKTMWHEGSIGKLRDLF